ncbi:ribonuclease T2 family protein [Pseudooceanicola marinus]|uniref:ribonuclease T2 family protein n=1 Tax=Pseudooceanicola marinus TaxID=396013 RepID=UPI001CD3D0F2|nr:ribonuclease T2 [Pseudooceanicola marinus]MCA1337709.1 ribonuclease T2 [Pseudooceanicola marinus]
MRRTLVLLMILLMPLRAVASDRPGDFDYYVMALSWSPAFCEVQGDPEQCAPGKRFGWILHGLWPQHEQGYPRDCRSPMRNPSRADTAAMADIMATAGLAWHEWQAHGRCSGLSSDAYFALSRQAYDSVTRPQVLRQLDEDVRLPARVIEEAFLEANPHLSADGVTVTCPDNRIREVRICLTKDLQPRDCASDVRRDCRASSALFDAIGG